jgi:hypothetical protein
VERDREEVIRTAIASGDLEVPRHPATVPPLLTVTNWAGAPTLLAADPSGACAFHDGRARRCSIHRSLGARALPVSCAHFPRVLSIDSDGVYVSMSHYCPTVADLLFEGDEAVDVVEAPSLLEDVEPEGLDSRDELPPLLRRDLLADRPSYRRWERWAVNELGAARGGPQAALSRVAAVARHVAAWRPERETLEARISGCISLDWSAGSPHSIADSEARSSSTTTNGPAAAAESAVAVREAVRLSVPPAFRPAAISEEAVGVIERHVDPALRRESREPAGRYLAAKAFGSWAAYGPRGMTGVVEAVFEALGVLRAECARQCMAAGRPLDAPLLKEAARQADLLLVHLRPMVI